MTIIKTICKKCIFATTERVESGATELRCHKQHKAKHGFDSCEEGKDRQEARINNEVAWA